MNISEMIEVYGLCKGKPGTLFARVKLNDMQISEIKAHKQEILDYMDEVEKEETRKRQAAYDTFEAIPGVRELRQAYAARATWGHKFSAAMESEDSVFTSAAPQTDIEAIKSKYPLAVFALKTENDCSNMQIAAITNTAHDALCAGVDPQQVKDAYDASMSDFTNSHIFD